MGGIGLVILRNSTGVLNFAYGAIAAASAMFAWQIADWGLPGVISWVSAVLVGIGLSVRLEDFEELPFVELGPAALSRDV